MSMEFPQLRIGDLAEIRARRLARLRSNSGRAARAYTGRELVPVNMVDQPFESDDFQNGSQVVVVDKDLNFLMVHELTPLFIAIGQIVRHTTHPLTTKLGLDNSGLENRMIAAATFSRDVRKGRIEVKAYGPY